MAINNILERVEEDFNLFIGALHSRVFFFRIHKIF